MPVVLALLWVLIFVVIARRRSLKAALWFAAGIVGVYALMVLAGVAAFIH